MGLGIIGALSSFRVKFKPIALAHSLTKVKELIPVSDPGGGALSYHVIRMENLDECYTKMARLEKVQFFAALTHTRIKF